MKALSLVLLLLPSLLSAGGKTESSAPLPQGPSEDPGTPAELFQMTSVPEITLTFPRDQYDQLLANFDAKATNEIYVRGDFQFKVGNTTVSRPQVGLRIRGNGFSRVRPEADLVHRTRDTEWQKPHFRVSFDEYIPKNTFYGLESLNLKMFNVDTTYLRENIAMDLFRQFGVFTYTRILYVRVFLQVQGDPKPGYLGVYRLLEPIDKKFLKDRFPENQKGFLWKCLYPSPLTPSSVLRSSGVEDPDAGKSFAYDLKTRKTEFETARAQLYDFAEKLSTLKGEALQTWAQEHINLELLLRSMALSNALGSMDDYWANVNNWYLYFDESGKAHFIPYDYDNVLGNSMAFDPVTLDPFKATPGGEKRPLIDTLLEIPAFKAQYAGYLKALVEPGKGLMTWENVRPTLQKWAQEISPYLSNDTYLNEVLVDAPADWGRYSHLRMLNETDSSGEINFFRARTAYIWKVLKEKGYVAP